ncbi:MAG TPA: class I SAM-dependent methyltransferase [Acidimicrobiales bacterium]|nr:class I SAM-dependent methyltransferase [Acidimicrobiales bacterium]
MNRSSIAVTPELHDYILEHSAAPDDVQRSLMEETAKLGRVSGMQIGPEQGAFMTLLTKVMNVKLAVEVGTFTGYSSLCIARGLAPGGRLICCDVSDEWTSIGRRHWEQAGMADRIDLRIAPAIETLRSLPKEPEVDLAFIDADKSGYLDYYEELVTRVRSGGVLLVDNVLWSGRVIDPDVSDDDTSAIRAFNDHVAADDRVDTVMLPIGDGLTLAYKK